MRSIALELDRMIHDYENGLGALSEKETSLKASPTKWSKKELVGHLIDSAQNNIRRMVVGQYENEPHIIYNQDAWVKFNHYQECDYRALIQLFISLNRQLSSIISHMAEENKYRLCRTESAHILEWIARDYLLHLKHHLHQILDLEPVAYP
jgi:hypothetical protein